MSNALEKFKNERISLDWLCESCGAGLFFTVGDALRRLERSEPLEVRCERCGAVQERSEQVQFQVEVGAQLVSLCWPLLTPDERVREAYRQLLAIGEARLSFALAIEAIRTGSKRDPLELAQAHAALGRMQRIYDERAARRVLLLLESKQSVFRENCMRAAMAFERYAKYTEQLWTPAKASSAIVGRVGLPESSQPSLTVGAEDREARAAFDAFCREDVAELREAVAAMRHQVEKQ